jgi:hypothetical protein
MRDKEEDPYDLNVEMIQDNHLHTYDEGKVSGADDNSFENENDTIMKMMNQYMIIIMKLIYDYHHEIDGNKPNSEAE